jgi:hypothetical protein
MAKDTINIPLNIHTTPTVNARVALVINMDLVCGPDGHWDILRAKVTKSDDGAQPKTQPAAPLNTGQHPLGQNSQITHVAHKQIWRPKADPPTMGHDPSYSGSSHENQASSSLSKPPGEGAHVPNPMAPKPLDRASTAPSPADLATTTTSEDSDWALQLRDGHHLVFPSIPMAPLSSNPFFALSSECLEAGKFLSTDMGAGSVEERTESGELDFDSSLELYKYEQGGVVSDEGIWDDDALWVEPLAISLPEIEERLEEKGILDDLDNSTGDSQPPQPPKGPQSDWGLNKLKEFGEYLGASYDGFEDRVMKLLCEIEASTGVTRINGEGSKQHTLVAKPRVHRELRNLISNVNYEGGSSRRSTSTSGRAMILS